MMLRFSLACGFLLITHFCVAQNFRQGYVRMKGGQDQLGLIGEIRPGIPESLEYKASDSSAVILYKASDVAGYGITNGIYFTSFLNPGSNSNNWSFVELLVEGGEMTLIRRNNMYFVLSRGTNQFVHLDSKYRSVLNSIMSNCPWVASKSAKVKMNKTALTEHVKAYNECVAIKNPNLDGMQRTVSVGLVIGYDNTTASFSDKVPVPTRYLAGEPLRDKSFVQAGVDFTFKSYKVSNYVGMYGAILYNSNRYAKVSKLDMGSTTEINEYSIDYTQLKIPIGFEFSPPSRKRILMHLRAGAIFPTMLNLTSSHPSSEVNPNSSGTIYYQEPAQLVSFKNKTMFMGAIGFDFKVATQSKVRVQFSVSSGRATAVVKTDDSETTIKGKIVSLNVMTGFIF